MNADDFRLLSCATGLSTYHLGKLLGIDDPAIVLRMMHDDSAIKPAAAHRLITYAATVLAQHVLVGIEIIDGCSIGQPDPQFSSISKELSPAILAHLRAGILQTLSDAGLDLTPKLVERCERHELDAQRRQRLARAGLAVDHTEHRQNVATSLADCG